ncbi:MAG TPA: OmpA family protein [Candidatus Binatia bacterium]|jgi:outer membrane protein OmpA-like peptidoglycan-associated protein|nr:OmpA family protein [Candidatus Binatia bacterium]
MMHRRNILVGSATLFFAAGFLPVGYAHAQRTIAEQHAAIAREQAELAQENAERAAQEAAVAEEQAARAARRSSSARIAELERELADLKAHNTERGLVLTLGDVLFAPSQSELTASAMRKLYPLVTILEEQPRRSIYIEGYADSSGTESYNLDLSQRRADAVRDFLIDSGISPSRIIARGYGEADPVASNATTAGRRENRRVEVIVPRAGKRVTAEMR